MSSTTIVPGCPRVTGVPASLLRSQREISMHGECGFARIGVDSTGVHPARRRPPSRASAGDPSMAEARSPRGAPRDPVPSSRRQGCARVPSPLPATTGARGGARLRILRPGWCDFVQRREDPRPQARASTQPSPPLFPTRRRCVRRRQAGVAVGARSPRPRQHRRAASKLARDFLWPRHRYRARQHPRRGVRGLPGGHPGVSRPDQRRRVSDDAVVIAVDETRVRIPHHFGAREPGPSRNLESTGDRYPTAHGDVPSPRDFE